MGLDGRWPLRRGAGGSVVEENKWKTVRSVEYGRGDAYRIQFVIARPVSEYEKEALYKAGDLLEDAMLKAEKDADPKTHETARENKDAILACFGGLTNYVYIEEIPNGYCSRGCCAFFPWFIVTTPIGRIKIGWRKRVIHLEWTDSAIKQDAKAIFPGEEAWPGYETTQYDKVIHAHSYEAAAKYIERLFIAAREGQ